MLLCRDRKMRKRNEEYYLFISVDFVMQFLQYELKVKCRFEKHEFNINH